MFYNLFFELKYKKSIYNTFFSCIIQKKAYSLWLGVSNVGKEREERKRTERTPRRQKPPGVREKKQNTHKAILHQAKVLFEKEGIGNVTIEQISESADVSRSHSFALCFR